MFFKYITNAVKVNTNTTFSLFFIKHLMQTNKKISKNQIIPRDLKIQINTVPCLRFSPIKRHGSGLSLGIASCHQVT